LTSADETGKSYNLSGRTVSRYLRICNLIKELLDKLDTGEIPFTACVELSYLTEEEKHIVNNIVVGTKFKIDIKKAEFLREFSEKKNLNKETAHLIISGKLNKKLNKFSMIRLNPKIISKYFSPEVKQHEIEDIIDKALKLFFDAKKKEILDE
jgi:ParB family chromosome partitioning protein